MSVAGRIFLFATMGHMRLCDVVKECHNDQMAPILIIRQPDGKVLVPSLPTVEMALSFGKRNIGRPDIARGHVWGTIISTQSDIDTMQREWIEGKGWQFLNLNFPRLIKNLGLVDIEVHTFDDKPAMYEQYGSRGQNRSRIESTHKS